MASNQGSGKSVMMAQLQSDVSMWKIALVVIVGLVLFAPAAIWEIPVTTILGVIALTFATVVAYRASVFGWGALWQFLVVFPATLIGILFTVTVILPFIFSRVSFNNWSALASQHGVIPDRVSADSTLNSRLDSISSMEIFNTNISGVGTAQQTLEYLPAEELSQVPVQPAAVVDDPNAGGGVPPQYTQPAAVVVVAPTPTPNPLGQLPAQLASAYASGDMINVGRYALEILKIDPNHVVANRAMDEFNFAKDQSERRSNLPLGGIERSDMTEEAVALALSGDSYKVIDDGAERWALSCGETAIIQQETGALKGDQYQVARCLIEQFGASDTNDTFTVQ